jgi:F-type H+-transporting ATPase subunit alpha
MKALSGKLRLEYIQYQELLQMTQLRTTGLSKEAEERMKRGQAITQLLVQDKNKPFAMEAEIILLFALSIGVLDNLSTTTLKKFKDEFMSKFIEWYPDLFLQLRKSQVLDDSNIEKLYEALGRYFQAV